MHILWINEYSSLLGGAERYILNTVSLLKNHGITSTFLYDPRHISETKLLKIFHGSFPFVDIKRQVKDISPDLIFLHQAQGHDLLKELVNLEVPVLKFFHDLSNFCIRRCNLPIFSNKPCFNLNTCHCHPLSFSIIRQKDNGGLKINTLNRVKKEIDLIKQFAGFVVPSEFMVKQLKSYGFDSEKIYKCPLYVNYVKPEKTKKDKNLILFVGSLVRGKGVDVLLRAMTQVKDSIELVIIGEGSQGDQYRKLSEKLKLSQRVRFLGKLNEQELSAWYQKAYCLIFPVRVPETFGLVGPEAMRFGTPAIGSSIGGIDEWLKKDKTGLSIPYNDPSSLAKAIETLYHHPKLHQTMSLNCIQSYQSHFRPEQHLKLLKESFHKTLENSKTKKRYTLYGSDKLESKINHILVEISSKISHEISSNLYQTIALIGGYGKGEGGVAWKDSKECPHNNLDLIAVSKGGSPKKLKSKLDQLLQPISERYDIGIDSSVILKDKLKRSANLVIWYEMYHGHKHLLGDPEFIKSLPFHSACTIPVHDIQNLMRNRCMLLIINDWLLDKHHTLNDSMQKVFIRHVIKAVIGMGDAFLFFIGNYHWSYQEKLKRVQQSSILPVSFKKRYLEAANFRFQPDYEKFSHMNLKNWQDEIRKELENIYLLCESIRMKQGEMTWDHYLSHSLQFSMREWQHIGRKMKGILHFSPILLGHNLYEKLAFTFLSPEERLNLVLPYLAFNLEEDLTRIEKLFHAQNTSDLKLAFLNQWKIYGDENFGRLMEKWERK